MKKALFIGNSINQLESNISWNQLLENIIQNIKKTNIISLEEKPYPLLYEEIYTRGKKYANYDENKIRQEIIDATKQISVNTYHKQLMDLPFENILTTNYDYCLDIATNDSFLVFHKQEHKYNLFRRRETQNQKKIFWHIHGEIDYKQSLTIGYEHYVGAIQKMRNYLTSGIDVQKQKTYRSPYIRKIMNFETDIYSWIDIFLRDEIHIVGLGFDFHEIDLWWLLTYRNRLILDKKIQCGKLFYYHFDKNNIDKKTEAKLALLETLDVKIVKILSKSIDPKFDYESAWDNILEKLKFAVEEENES